MGARYLIMADDCCVSIRMVFDIMADALASL
jgi:hypothetical protein